MKIAKDALKQAASGRRVDILVSVGGISEELLDGKHHPCPKCGGTDRFRLVDEPVGACFCSQCFNKRNGDGIAAIQWKLDCSFPDAVAKIGAYLGMKSSGYGSVTTDLITWLARQKKVTPEALKLYGAIQDDGFVRIPAYDEHGRQCTSLRIWCKGLASQRRGLFEKGKPAGLFLPHENGTVRLPQPGEMWVVVEGPKDAAALSSLNLLAAGLPRNEMGKKFARLFRGCNVIIVHDLDQAGLTGSQTTASRLHGMAAAIRVVRLPGDIKASGGDDVRDVLAGADGERIVRQAIADAQAWKPTDGGSAANDGLIKIVADLICEDGHFARDAGGKLYHYSGGAYRNCGEQYIKTAVKHIVCHEMGKAEEWSTRLASEILEFIRVDAPELWAKPPLDILNVENGLLRVDDRRLLPHTPAHLSAVQMPVRYDPDATCPATDKFDSQVFPADAIDLAREIPAWLMLPDTSIQKSLLLVGEGGNGKSRKLEQIRAFLGKSNTAAVSLHKLEADRFSVARLIGKLADVCPDLPSEHLAGTSVFKAITGGDALNGEYKFRDSFDFTPFCRLVFSANHLPRSQDASEAFFDRWVVIRFDARFRGTGEEISSGVLDATLQSPQELSGLLNHALDALTRIRATGGLSEPESVREACEEFRATTDPLVVWLNGHTVNDPNAVVPKSALRASYGAECERKGRPILTDTAFAYAFKKHRPHIQTAKRAVNGRRKWCYVGLGLVPGSEQDGQGVQGVQGSFLYTPREDVDSSEGIKEGGSSVEQVRAEPGHPGHIGRGEGAEEPSERGFV